MSKDIEYLTPDTKHMFECVFLLGRICENRRHLKTSTLDMMQEINFLCRCFGISVFADSLALIPSESAFQIIGCMVDNEHFCSGDALKAMRNRDFLPVIQSMLERLDKSKKN